MIIELYLYKDLNNFQFKVDANKFSEYRLEIISRTTSQKRLKESLNIEYLLLTVFNKKGLSIPPNIKTTKNKKPYLENSSISFSLAHTEDLYLVGLYNENIGVDVERKNLKHLVLAKRVLSSKELKHFCALGAAQRVDYFYRCWCTKEALLKFLDIPILMDISKIEVSDSVVSYLGVDYKYQIIADNEFVISVVTKELARMKLEELSFSEIAGI